MHDLQVVLSVLVVPVLRLILDLLSLQVVHGLLDGRGNQVDPSLHLFLVDQGVQLLQWHPTQPRLM